MHASMCVQQLSVSQINLTHGPDNKNVTETKNAKKGACLKSRTATIVRVVSRSTGRVFSVGRSCEKVSFELGVMERELRMVRAVNRRRTTIC